MKPFVTAILSLSLASGAARADSYSSLIGTAAGICRSDAEHMRQQAAYCRAHSTPDPQTGQQCTGLSRTETGLDGAQHVYQLSPDAADSLADRFEAYAPTLEAAARDLVTLEEAAEKTKDKIRKLGFQKRNEDYAGWLALAEDSRKELTKETRKFLIARAIDAPEQVERGIARLTRGRAEQLAAGLERYGEAGIELGKKLKRIARIEHRRERAEAAGDLIHDMHFVYDAATRDDDLDGMLSLAVYFGEAEGLDGLGFLVDEVKWATAAVYAYGASTVASDQIDRLTAMHLVDLRALKSLTELLERQVHRIEDATTGLHPCLYGVP